MKNDWIVANLNNPDFTVSDFQNIADMSTSNTQMLSKDQYLKSDFIKSNEAFKDEQGRFSQKKFDDFYNSAAKSFQDFRTHNTTDGLEYDIFDIRRTPDSKVKRDNLNISKNLNNPDRQQIGIEGVNIWSDPILSKAEIAQSQQIFNTATGKFEEYTPNDQALFNGKSDFGLSWIKSLFSDPLVLATYDKDEIDSLGRKHYKGEYKLNNNGTYYYETLNGRSPVGKEVLSSLDNLTREGTKVNKYDFFDSDDIEKSVAGTVAKNVASLIPIFIGGPVGATYSTLLIAKEMAKAMPMLYSMSSALLGGPETPTWMNSLAAMGDKFSSGTSQYAKQNTFAFENFGNLVADVALQWGQQKTIAQAFNKLKNSENLVQNAYKDAQALYIAKATDPEWIAQAGNPSKWTESALGKACIKKFVPDAEKAMVQQSQLGRDASLMYMSIVSNSDVYNDAIDKGATRQEAAAVAFGSTLGMFAVDKYAHLGEIFFDDATEESVKAARRAIKKELIGDDNTKGLQEILTKGIINNPEVAQNSAKKYLTIINNSANKIKELFKGFNEDLKYHTLGFFGKAVGEGTEEVAEEFITDTAKSLYSLAGVLGANTSVKDLGAWDNAFDRYTMSFLGGAVGGGVFYAKESLSNIKQNKQDQEMAALIRNGHAQELRDYIETLRKKGKLGSTNLSGTKYTEVTDDEGNVTGRTWLTAENAKDSQNELIAKHLNNKITAIEAVINNNELGLSDDQLFNNMVLQESRYKAYKDNAAITGYYDQFNDIFSDITKAQADYDTASNSVDGTVNGNPIPNDNYLHGLTPEQQQERTNNLEKLKQKLEDAKAKKDQFLSGEVSIDYIRKLNFAMDKVLHSQFMGIDEEQLWNQMFQGKKRKDASEEELKQYYEELDKRQTFSSKEQLTQSWNRFKNIEEVLKPSLHNLGEESKDYLKYFEQWQQLEDKLTNIESNFKTWEDKLDSESDEDYNNRDVREQLETEEQTDKAFKIKQALRRKAINDYNNDQLSKWAEQAESLLSKINYQVDPITMQRLNWIIPTRIKNIINYTSTKYPELDNDLTLISPDLSNIDEVKQKLREVQNFKTKESLQSSLKELVEGEFIDIDGNKTILPDFDEQATFKDLEDDEQRQNIVDFLNEILSPDSVDRVIQLLDKLKPYVDKNTHIQDFITDGVINDIDDELNNGTIFDAAVSDILNNPIVKLKQKLQSSIKNPILEITKELVGKVVDEKQQEDVARMLDIIQHNYDTIDSIDDLQLDSEQIKTLQLTKDALQLVNTYIYAASSEPSSTNTIGHNKVINEYAEKHKDLISKFDKLPEINLDYSVLFQSSIKQFISNLDTWIELSNRNAVNKRKLFSETDKALVRSFTEFWKQNNFQVTINGNNYNLLEGLKNDSNPSVNLFNYENIFYQNVQKILENEKISITEFLNQTGLLDSLVQYTNIEKQDISRLSPQLEYKTLTSFDKLTYLSTILSLNPSDFYSFIKTEVNNNNTQAPIASQEYGIRVSIAHSSDTYKAIMKYAFDKSGSNMYNCTNTTIITGDAGAGKTSVVAKGIVKFFGNDAKVYCAGPTIEQAHGLFKSLNTGKEVEVKQFIQDILGAQQYSKIENDLKIAYKDEALAQESKYYHVYLNNGIVTAVIHPENITFNTLEDTPKLLIIDEATHIPSVYLQILNEYMKKTGGELILIGDKKQRSYDNPFNGIANMKASDLFATRTPELNVSLRDNNIQKSNNLQQVRALVQQALDNFEDLSESDWKDYQVTLKPLISKIQFHYYDNDSLTGEIITNNIDNLIPKLKGSIGFIGSESSAYYKQLVDAGLNPKRLSIDEMQGQEFDYVIIDHKLKLGDDYKQVEFLQDLYTLMSRGRTASIFIDNGLSSIIKPPVEDNYTANAPSLTDKVNGKSIIDELIQEKLSNLNQYDLTKVTPEVTPHATTTEISPTDFKAPEELVDPEEEKVDKAIKEESETGQNDTNVEIIDNNFSILSYGDITCMGVQAIDSEEVHPITHRKKKGKKWIFDHGNVRRNLSALTDEDDVFWYKDKIRLQDLLFKVKSMLIYNHQLDDTSSDGRTYIVPEAIRQRFKKEDWEQGVFKLEFRPSDNEITPIGSSLSKIGMNYKGSTFIANIVFEVKDKDGNLCIFDVAGINNPETFSSKKDIIKSNLQKRIDKETDASKKAQLQTTLDNLDDTITKYTNLFDSWVNEFKSKGTLSINIDDAIVRNGLTSFVKRTGAGLRLGGYTDPNNVDKPSSANFRNYNPGYVVSKVYTYACDNPELMKIDPSIKGRAVVFVSSDTLLDPNDLINIYINQKTHPEESKPTVRMIKLDNYGMQFSQLYDDKLLSSVYKKGQAELPFRTNYHGIQMFVSLWNWRAALDNFTTALNKWAADNHYDQNNKLKTLLKVANDIYNNPNDKSNILSKNGLTQQDLDNLDKFNLEICKEIPIFRLGYSTKNDFHIQRFDVKGSSAYRGKDAANLIVITPEKAIQFQKLSNRILEAILPSKFDIPSLNLQLLKADGSEWDQDEYIDIKEAKHQRTLSGLFKNDLAIEDADGHFLVYKDGIQWSLIPKLLDRMVKNITFYQNNPNLLTGDYSESIHIKVNKGKDDEYSVSMQFGDLIADKVILDNDSNNGKFDSSLYDMFDLMFHGTTEDIHRKYSKDKPLVQADDARFPRGFFINPDITRQRGTNSSNIATEYKGEVVYYPIQTPDEFFTVDVDMRNMGIGLSLDKLLNNTQQVDTSTTSQPTVPSQESPAEPNKSKVIQSLCEKYGYDDSEDPEDVIDDINSKLESNLTTTIASSNNKNDIIVKYQIENNDVVPITLGDIISSKLNGKKFTIQLVTTESNQEIQVVTDDTIYTFNPKTFELEGQSSAELLSTQQPYGNSTVIDSIIDIVQGNLKDLNATDINIDTDNPLYEKPEDNPTLTAFMQQLTDLKDAKSENVIEQIKHNISENIDYYGYLAYVLSKDEQLYNRLFSCQ